MLDPPVEVTALVNPQAAGVLGRNGNYAAGLSEVVVYDKRGGDKGFGSFRSLGKKLRENNFDIVVSPHRSYRSAALALLTRAPVRIGFNENALWPVWTSRVERRWDLHEVNRNVGLLEPLGGLPKGFVPAPEVAVTIEGVKGAVRIAGGFFREELKVGVAPGSIWGTKRWPAHYFSRFIDMMRAEREEARFVLVGGPGDVGTAAAVKDKAEVDVLDLSGKTGIEEMVGLIRKLDILVTNDTGPMHVAAALGIPVVAIFGATTPGLGFAPYTDKRKVVEPPGGLDCRPCGLHGPKSCPKGHFKCMNDITPEAVLDATLSLLNSDKK